MEIVDEGILLNKPKLFNPSGLDSTREMINGNSTNIINLNNVKYQWANQIYRGMLNCFWIPEKIDLSNDKIDDLTEHERKAFYGILSFLTFLDSIQTNNLPNIADYITAPEVKICLGVQQFFEIIHSQSYGYIIETLIPVKDRDYVYDYWRTDPVLLERNTYIASIYQDFVDDQSFINFKRVLIANFLLEGVYFFAGFLFFYNLASREKMVGTAAIIKLINRDELIHCTLFENIIRETFDIQKEKELIYSMFNEAVKQDINWSTHIIGDNILGFNSKSLENYIKYIANRRLKYLGLDPLYDNPVNQFKHLERTADLLGEGFVKANYFETSVTAYNMASSINDWDKI